MIGLSYQKPRSLLALGRSRNRRRLLKGSLIGVSGKRKKDMKKDFKYLKHIAEIIVEDSCQDMSHRKSKRLIKEIAQRFTIVLYGKKTSDKND